MSEAVKHTPGPWGKQEEFGDFMIVGPNGEFIAGAVDAENADVIVAAPDLLQALRGLLDDIEEYQRINNLGGENNHWQVISRSAIAKAEGR